MPRICSDRYSKAFGPHRGDTFGRSCAALPLPQCSGAAARSAWSKRYGAAGPFCAAGTGSGAFGCMFLPGDQPLLCRETVEAMAGISGWDQRTRLERQKKQNGRSSVWDSGSVTTRLPLPEVPFCLKRTFSGTAHLAAGHGRKCSASEYPRMFTPFTLRIGMNWPTPTRPKHWRNWKHWPGRSFELYTALSSFGSSTFSRIATNAAGTMPDSPQISCKACGACARMPLLAPMP